MALRRKVDYSSKMLLKEKVVEIYERFFQGEDPSLENPNFWDELFLLKPNYITYLVEHLHEGKTEARGTCEAGPERNAHQVYKLQSAIENLSGDHILELSRILRRFFSECIKALDHKHHIRILYSLQTLCALISSMYSRTRDDCNFDIINALIGFEDVEKRMHELVFHCHGFLVGDWPNSLKSMCLKLLLSIATGTDVIDHNILLEYLMVDNIFESLIKLLCNATYRLNFGRDVILLLTLLMNYRKPEAANPYIVKLSILDDELSLNGYGSIIAQSLTEFSRQLSSLEREPQTINWLASLTNIVGNIFVAEDKITDGPQIRTNTGVMLSLYEIVHLNRNFVSILAHTQTELNSEFLINSDASLKPSDENSDSLGKASEAVVSEPSNLLVAVFQFCSIAMQNIKSEEAYNNVKLCFIVLTCITEDQYANSMMHDFHLVFRVQLLRAPMRHRQPLKENVPQSLAVSLLDLLVEFIMSHMMKRLPVELYRQCIGIIHRLLCYQKKCTVRINYNWKVLWEALITLLKFLIVYENHASKEVDVFSLISQIINVFNLFITYGDTFLASPRSYDLLYYEIIRMRTVFENVYSLVLKYSSVNGDFRDPASNIISGLINIRSIINHFSPKIEKWIAENSCSPSEDEVLNILRRNYDSLTLKLLDNLDQYSRYTEKPNHVGFFSVIVRQVILDTRKSIDYTSFSVHKILREFSSIS